MGHKKLVETDASASYPTFLKKAHQATSNKSRDAVAPIVIKMGEKNSSAQLEKLINQQDIRQVIDNYAEQYAELLLSRNAHLYRANHDVQVASIRELLEEHYAGRESWQLGSWVYYPWSGELIHVLGEEDFTALRTIRNRDLITEQEQQVLAAFPAICFGMSVGSASALALAISGTSRQMKLVDGAVISGSNLNRILTGVRSVGVEKQIVIARAIYEMNPYSEVLAEGKVTAANIGGMLDKPWPVKVLIDEIDDIEMKIRIRLEARKRKLPVLMATELADTVMLDVERYDLEPNRELFHNLVPGVDKLAEKPPENHREWMKYAVRIIDPQNMPISMQQSLLKIGSTIVTHPQLGSTVMMTGGVIAFGVKQIALGNNLPSGRYVISLEKQLLPDHRTRKHKRAHKRHTKVIESAIKAM